MDNLEQFTQIDWKYVLLSICLFLIVLKFIWSLLDWLLVEKLGIETRKMKQRREDHELIVANSKAIKELAELHKNDNDISNEHDKNIQDELSSFIEEMRYKIEQIAFDRINDREKSREIRADLAGSIKIIAEDNEKKEQQINVLLVAQKEVLAGLINERYKQYINLQGIPEDELDEFVNLHQAYKACGGNSVGDAKYEYCIKHLSVIPSGRKLEIKHRT